MTTQLNEEIKHIEKFKNIICPKYGLIILENWGSGNKNKKTNCDADLTVEIIDMDKFNELNCATNYKLGDNLTVSLKTIGGNFTIANGGTGLNSGLFKHMILSTHICAKEEFNKRKLKIKKYICEIGKNKRWSDVGQDKKLFIKRTLQELLWLLFNVPVYRTNLYEWLNSRQSDLKCVGDKLFVPDKKKLSHICEPKFCGNDSVIVGHYKLRVKASGSKVCSSWKINYEVIQ